MPNHHSGQPAAATTTYAEMRRRLRPLLKNKRLGLPAFEAYCELWELVGLRPGKVAIASTELAGLIGRSPRRIRDWTEAWQHFGIVELIAYDSPTNTYHLYVNEPERAFQPQVLLAPPQAELFRETAAKPPAESPSIEPAAKPRRKRLEDSGQKSLFLDAARDTAAEPPSMVYGTIESGTIGSASSSAAAAANEEAKEKLLTGLTLTPTGTSRATAAIDPVADGWAQVAAEINRRRDELKGVTPLDPSDPAELRAAAKARIVDRFKSWADGLSQQCDSTKRMSTARAGQVADHVLIDGLPEAELWGLCDAVRQDWLDDQAIKNPVAVFDHRFEKLLIDRGIATRAKAKRRRA